MAELLIAGAIVLTAVCVFFQALAMGKLHVAVLALDTRVKTLERRPVPCKGESKCQ